MKHLKHIILVGTALLATGCPTFEDEFTGKYQEVPTDERTACFESRQCNLVEIDFFRFGDFAHAVVREYAKGLRNTINTPYVEQTSCTWTKADRFGRDAQTFSLPLQQLSPEPGLLRGRVINDESMDAEILEPGSSLFNTDGSLDELRLELVDDDPRPVCESVNDYLLTAEVKGQLPDSIQYPIRNPVFVLLWLGLERFESEGGVVYLPTQGPSTWWRLPSGAVNQEGSGLSGSVSIQVPPPEDKFMSISGDTRFSLAHLVVADDEDEEGRFNWSVSDEPIVAVGVRPGRPDGPQYEELDEPSFGKALFFVEGSLFELDRATQQRITNLEAYEYPEQHYYIVDVVADGDEIIEIRLPETLAVPRPNVPVTDAHLEASRIELPRLFPGNQP